MSILKGLLISLVFSSATQILLAESRRVDPVWGSLRDYNKVFIQKVIRVDTFILESGEKIRLIGLSAPNPPRKGPLPKNEFGIPLEKEDPTNSLEEQALGFVKNLLEGRYVRLEFDVQKKDEDLYTLAYAFLPDGTFVNAEILRQGFADLRTQPPNTQYAHKLKGAYQEARQEKRGLQGE